MVYISEDVCRTGEEGGMMDGGVGGVEKQVKRREVRVQSIKGG